MIYLSSPYSHDDPLIVKTRYLLTCQCTVNLIRKGKHVWSPIVHSHVLAQQYTLPTDAEWWWEWSRDFIRRCDGILVLKIPGWEESKGIFKEVQLARELGLPRGFVNEQGEDIL